jgi:signal transduction histidine kinase
MSDRIFYRIYNEKGKKISDTFSMQSMMGEMQMDFQSSKNWKTSTADIIVNHKKVGKIVAFYPAGLYDREYTFLRRIQMSIVLAILITIGLSFLASWLFSKRLTSGLKTLADAVVRLKAHRLTEDIPVYALSGEVKELGQAFNDLNHSLKKEEALRQRFTHDFAHELRTPLATLRSQIEAFQDGIWEPTPERLQQSHHELMRIVNLVDELERLMAAENPQIQLQKENLDVNELLRYMDDLLQRSFQEKGVTLITETSSEKNFFLADKERVIQILINIMQNALKYTPAAKHVRLSPYADENMAGFIVEDEGIGIPEEDLPYIFERFYRGDKSRDRKTGGIGIGLSIVKALMDAHKGKIEVKSKIGEGTTITLLFPKISEN